MAGGLMQLVAYGTQDMYLTGNPQVTFFKAVFRRYTNFSMESIKQNFSGNIDFGRRITCTISRNGDLINRLLLEIELPTLEKVDSDLTNTGNNTYYGQGWVDEIGHAIIKSVELEIGGQLIDKHYSEWFSIWNELSLTEGQKNGYNQMIGNQTNTQPVYNQDYSRTRFYIPLIFWFNRNPGTALPLIALQYHEVKINLELNSLSNVLLEQRTESADWVKPFSNPNVSIVSCNLYVDYIYLDTDERKRFANANHEYLIEQVQQGGNEAINGASSIDLKLTLNHPIKELIWIFQTTAAETNLQHFNFTDYVSTQNSRGIYNTLGKNCIESSKLLLNGHDRFESRKGSYFNLVQPYQHHSSIPKSPGINVYSFAINPEDIQPSGSCNFSRIDNADLNIEFNGNLTGNIRLYGLSYNILRIMGGMGGLAYSN